MVRTVLDTASRSRWHADGWCVLEDLIPAEEIAAAAEAAAVLFPSAETGPGAADPTDASPYDVRWDGRKPVFPFASPALNQLCVHETLIELAQDLLGTDRVRMYQGLASIKVFEGHADYEQLLHVDYGNHTLVVPRDDAGYQHLELFVYLSDVTSERAATRFVSRRLTGDIPIERTYLSLSEYAPLYAAEEPATGPAGAVLAYRPDVYHRGTALTEEGAVRYLLHVAFKPVGTDWLGFQAWPQAAEDLAWHRFVDRATPRQLTVLGFPEPGHPYWNAETLRGVAARYPGLDMTPWIRASAGGS
jgi:hypothetical protein